MQWSAEPNAGFTTGRPWLPIGLDAAAVNVERQREDSASLLRLYRRLLALRREHAALSLGAYEAVDTRGDILAYIRSVAGDRCLMALNLGSTPQSLTTPESFKGGRVLGATRPGLEQTTVDDRIHLDANEGVIVTPP